MLKHVYNKLFSLILPTFKSHLRTPTTIPSDIISIIISYMTPPQLINYFKTHELNHKLRFKYNALPFHLPIQEFIFLFNIFPNIILIGLNYYIDSHSNTTQHIFTHRLFTHHLQHIELRSALDKYNYDRFPIVKTVKTHSKFPLSILFIKNCSNLTHLQLNSFALSDCHILCTINLHYLSLTGSTCDTLYPFPSKTLRILSTPILSQFNISKYPHIRNLTITECTTITNTTITSTTPTTPITLTTLRIHQTFTTTLHPLNYTNLSSLSLSSCPNLIVLPKLFCPNLIHIELKECPLLTSITNLNNCTNLKTITISHITLLFTLTGLNNCHNLEKIYLENCNILHINDLIYCTNLTSIYIIRCNTLQNLNALSLCTKIKSFDFRYCKYLNDITGLSNCHNLIITHECSRNTPIKYYIYRPTHNHEYSTHTRIYAPIHNLSTILNF